MRTLFTITIFLSSFLLFLIEPMIAKMILPRFGGSPGVWNTSMLFFQIALLAGYGYAHLSTKALGPRRQSILHFVVLLAPLLLLPFAAPAKVSVGTGSPAPLVLLALTLAVGAPFFVVSAGAPLLQRWFASTNDPHAHDPYFLYSASNVGSMLALLAYPFLIEPRLRLAQQSAAWTWLYYGLVILMAVCIAVLFRSRGKDEPIAEAPATLPPEAEPAGADGNGEEINWRRRLRWIALAFCPSSLLLGVTTYLTSNIAPIPLLWVVPLALYLLTFIVAFARKQWISTQHLGRIAPLLVLPLAFTIVLEASEPNVIVVLISLHLITFFAVSLMCHLGLAEDRPHARHLTEFFFYVSLGGVLGGLFNAILAPMMFNSYFEYPLVLAVACFFRPSKQLSMWNRVDWIYVASFAVVAVAVVLEAKARYPDPTSARSFLAIGIPLILVFIAVDRPFRFAGSLVLFFVITSVLQVASAGRIVEAKRSFFGIHRVEEYENRYGWFHGLIHGNTVHGKENFGAEAGIPLTYYYPTGPIGKAFEVLGPSRRSVALVGLGVGSLAYYGHPGESITYYEIDPDVVHLARDSGLFTFLRDCRAKLNIDIGDARLELEKSPPNAYDMIVLDAFSSDAIPMHLLTDEAISMYLSKLMPGGILAFHISNRYLDLKPVLGNEAAAHKLTAWVDDDPTPSDPVQAQTDLIKGKYPSIWVLMARSQSDFGELRRRDPAWEPLNPDPSVPVWTDDYSNIATVLKVFRQGGE